MTEQAALKKQLSLSVVKTEENDITISWVPVTDFEVDTYVIRYKLLDHTQSQWKRVDDHSDKHELTITKLVANSNYGIKISAEYDGELVMQNKDTKTTKTKESLAEQLIKSTEKVIRKEQTPVIYKLNRTVANLQGKTNIRTCDIHIPEMLVQESYEHSRRLVLLIGETGTGKTSFIDAIINYISGLKWEEDFRLEIADLMEEEENLRDKPELSQTKGITWYKIPQIRGSSVPFPIDIIDTPGFGDSQGVQRDKEIMDLLKTFFSNCDKNQLHHLHFVCFVVKASSDRLTLQQKYVFQSIISIFGNDVETNIVIVATHADSTDPRVLPALAKSGIMSKNVFKFDNQSMETTKDSRGKWSWRVSSENFRTFFELLQSLPPFKIEKTKIVLETRDKLKSTVQSLLNQVQIGVNALTNIKKERKIIKESELEMKYSKDFTSEGYEPKTEHVPCIKGRHSINCNECKMTCHFPCTIKKGGKISWCWAIDWKTGICMVCPEKCHWQKHESEPYVIRTTFVKVVKTVEDLKKKYYKADENVKDHTILSKEAKEKFKETIVSVETTIEAIKKCIGVLNESALLPNAIVPADYIEMLIQREEIEQAGGWNERIELYKKLKEQDNFVGLVNNDNFTKSQLFASNKFMEEFLEED